jgi:hypothetical protein
MGGDADREDEPQGENEQGAGYGDLRWSSIIKEIILIACTERCKRRIIRACSNIETSQI